MARSVWMEKEALIQLVNEIRTQKSERQNVELKACHEGFPKKIYDTLSSFSNQDMGGTIIFGVTDKPDFDICGVYDAESVQKKIAENCNQMEPKVRALVTICEIDGKNIVAAEIPGVEAVYRPVYYAGVGRIKGSYIRVGDNDEPMNEYEVYSYEAFRRRIRDDLRTVDKAKLDLFDKDMLEKYLELVKRDRGNLTGNVSDSEILELMGVMENGVPTLAGTMTFSRFPQIYFPQLCITAVVVPGTELGDTGSDGERFIDNARIQGPIQNMIEEATAFVRKNSRTKTIIGSDGKRHDKTEFPMTAVREAILNALVHRDYSIHTENTPVSIEMYRDRMEIKNSGGIYGNFPAESLGKGRPETRNAALSNILEILRITENRYSGIPTIYKEFEKAGLPEPEFKVIRGEFRVTFRNNLYEEKHPESGRNMKEALIEFCRKPRTRKELIDFTGKSRFYTMSQWVQPLVEEGKLIMSVPEKPKSPNQLYTTSKDFSLEID